MCDYLHGATKLIFFEKSSRVDIPIVEKKGGDHRGKEKEISVFLKAPMIGIPKVKTRIISKRLFLFVSTNETLKRNTRQLHC